MANLETFYLRLPAALQNLACSLEGWRIQHKRFGGGYSAVLRETERRTYWSQDQVIELRNRCLREFVQHCFRTVPFYQRSFREHGISPDDIKSLQDLSRLPILTKADVQENYMELVSRAVPEQARIVAHTSGTTGGGLRFATTLDAIQQQWAVWWRYRLWHGIQPGTWCGYFGGRSVVPLSQHSPPFWRYNYPARQILFSAYHMNADNLRAYVDQLRSKQPLWLHGYPSLLALVAAYLVDMRVDLGYQVQWITIGAENLLTQQSEVIHKAFGVRPKQHYGMAEAVANVSECEQGNLHVDEDFAAVEFVPNADGTSYKVIGTNFTNLATPLLRYDVQDTVTLSTDRCPCGRPGRVVASVDGRREDYVVLRNGARLGRLDHIFKDITHIREAQIYQQCVGEITIRVVRSNSFTEFDEAWLLREARQRLGADTAVAVEYRHSLERSRTGKLRFVVSDLREGQL